MAESISQESIQITGLPGAVAATRYVGATVSGYPVSGSFLKGDYIVDQTGSIYICTTAGSPGTWAQTGAVFTGGTIGNTTVTGTLTVTSGVTTSGMTNSGNTVLSGTNLNVYSSTVGGVVAASGQTLVYSGGQWVPGTIAASSTYALTNLTAQSGALSSITLYTAPTAGLYTISYYGKVTTAATTNSVLGPFTVTSTDPDSNTVSTVGFLTTQNSVTAGVINGSITVYAGSGTNIQYSVPYTSNGATAMKYSIYAAVGGNTANTAVSGVSSFNGRSGAVSPSSGDYTAATGVIPTTTNIAGKNKIINGDFYFSQRGTVFNYGSGGLSATSYNMDRWILDFNGNPILTVQQLSFANGTSLPGYIGGEPQYYANITCSSVGSGNTFHELDQRIENARLFNGQPVTISFWAKCDSARTISLRLDTSGSPNDTLNLFSNVNLSTSWAFYQATMTMPNITATGSYSTNSYLRLVLGLGAVSTSENFSFYGVQVEAGSTATQFTTAGGSIGGELALCQRYYYRISPNGVAAATIGFGLAASTTNLLMNIPVPVSMRVNPTALDSSGVDVRTSAGGIAGTFSNIYIETSQCGNQQLAITSTVTGGLTAGTGYYTRTTSSSGYVGFSAEL